MKKRVYEISLLNVLFTLLVIFIHVSSDAVVTLNKETVPYIIIMALWRMSSFVVQGFIFLSGFKMFYSLQEPLNYKKFYLSKLKKIVLPYCLWVIVYYLCYLLKGYFEGQNHLVLIAKYIISANIAAHFYFIIAIVQFYLLVPLWVWIRKKSNLGVALIFSFVIMIFFNIYLPVLLARKGIYFMYNDRVFTTYIFYFIAGIFAATEYERFAAFLKKNFALVTIAFMVVASINTVITYLWQTQRLTGLLIDTTHIIYCISAIAFCYAIALKCEKLYENPLIKNIDSASYYIYLTHMLFLLGVNAFMTQAGILAVRYSYPIRAICVYGISLAICIGYIKIKKINLIHKKV